MKRNHGPLFVISAAILWGVDGIVLRPYLYDLPVNIVVFIESTLVAILLTPLIFSRYKEFASLKLKDWMAFAGVALFGGAIGTLAITKALFYVNFVNLSIVILIQKLQPVFAIIFAWLILKERPSQKFYLWAFIAIISAYFMTFGLKSPNLKENSETLWAALYALAAASGFAISTVLSKRALKNTSFFTATYLRFLFSALILLIFTLFIFNFDSIASVSSTHVLVFLIIAFSTGGAAIFLYYYGLKKITASSPQYMNSPSLSARYF